MGARRDGGRGCELLILGVTGAVLASGWAGGVSRRKDGGIESERKEGVAVIAVTAVPAVPAVTALGHLMNSFAMI